jgi:membrane fusion protein (multidrug efflux system)
MNDTPDPSAFVVDDADTAAGERDAATARSNTRRTWLIRLAVVVVVVIALWGVWYVLFGRDHVSTDDAYVAADVAEVTPLVAAPVLAVNVVDTQFVKAGTVLVQLDPADASVALEQAEADLSSARRKYRQSLAMNSALGATLAARGAGIAQARAQLASANADAEKARIDFQRRQALSSSGAVSGDELTDARRVLANTQAAVATAQAAVAQAQAQQQSAQGDLAANQALVQGVDEDHDPGVLAAKARLAAAQLDMARLVIRAPIDGVVTRRDVQIGQRVAPGNSIMTIVPVGQAYVDANFKEGQLRRVRIGMPAEVTTDLYGSSVVFHGTVAGIGGGTGSSLAIIPAQNATGNWIKIVQRLPVRIDLRADELKQHPLRLGLSADATVDLAGH